MGETSSALVVGAGIVGVSSALRLLERGLSVTLVDKLAPGEGASFGNGGILATSSIVPVTTPALLRSVPQYLLAADGPLFLRWSYLPKLIPWLVRYLRECRTERTRAIAQQLVEVTGDSLEEHLSLAAGTPAERHIRKLPYAFAYRDAQAFENDAFGWSLRAEAGIPWETVEGDAVHEAEPALAESYRFLAVLSHQHGVVDSPGDYVKALARVFAERGGEVRRDEVAELLRADGRICGVRLSDGSKLDADHVVLATGAWSNQLLRGLGMEVPLESERGYHVELNGCSVELQHALMIADGKFVANPMSGRLRLAGLVEFGGLDAPRSAAPIRQLLAKAGRVFPGLQYEDHTEWMGHRPAPSDSLPLIGESTRAPGLVLAFGHHHVGLTSGPKAGRWVADLVSGQRQNVDLSPYHPDRFFRR